MKRSIILLLILLACTLALPIQSEAWPISNQSGTETSIYENVTVSTTALGFTAATIAPLALHSKTAFAVCYVSGGPINYKTSGTPTAALGGGIPVPVGSFFRIDAYWRMSRFLAIRTGSVDAVLNCEYQSE